MSEADMHSYRLFGTARLIQEHDIDRMTRDDVRIDAQTQKATEAQKPLSPISQQDVAFVGQGILDRHAALCKWLRTGDDGLVPCMHILYMGFLI